jgi:Ca2+-binding EF-hand superfamily protein
MSMPMPGAGYGSPMALSMFQSADTNRSGLLQATELTRALSSMQWRLTARTTDLLFKVFGPPPMPVSASGAGATAQAACTGMTLPQFDRLVQTVSSWQAAFVAADADRSNRLTKMEAWACLRSLGYNLPESSCDSILRSFSASAAEASKGLDLPSFVHVATELHSLTESFRRFDPAGTGKATMDYASFIQVVFNALNS